MVNVGILRPLDPSTKSECRNFESPVFKKAVLAERLCGLRRGSRAFATNLSKTTVGAIPALMGHLQIIRGSVSGIPYCDEHRDKLALKVGSDKKAALAVDFVADDAAVIWRLTGTRLCTEKNSMTTTPNFLFNNLLPGLARGRFFTFRINQMIVSQTPLKSKRRKNRGSMLLRVNVCLEVWLSELSTLSYRSPQSGIACTSQRQGVIRNVKNRPRRQARQEVIEEKVGRRRHAVFLSTQTGSG